MPGASRALMVPAISDDDVRGSVADRAVLEDAVGALVAVHVPGHDDVGLVRIQEILHCLAQAPALLHGVVLVRRVVRDVHHDHQPRRPLPVHRGQVALQPVELGAALPGLAVGAERHDVREAGLVRIPEGRVAAAPLHARGRVARQVVGELLALPLVIADDVGRRHPAPEELPQPAVRVPGVTVAVRVAEVPPEEHAVQAALVQQLREVPHRAERVHCLPQVRQHAEGDGLAHCRHSPEGRPGVGAVRAVLIHGPRAKASQLHSVDIPRSVLAIRVRVALGTWPTTIELRRRHWEDVVIISMLPAMGRTAAGQCQLHRGVHAPGAHVHLHLV
mmetsp:Transcript_110147/g.322296  ORF Transcript_110147/g.322296 Transcript_110147/m.322296 type:complete len:332 (-) Transcript_110147:424-1419(-)